MTENTKILFAGAGGRTGASFKHNFLIPALDQKFDVVDVIDTRLSGYFKYFNAGYCFYKLPSKKKWFNPFKTISSYNFNKHRQGTMYYVLKRSSQFEKRLESVKHNYEAIVQTTWQPIIKNKFGKPRFFFEDFTMKMSEREYPAWLNHFISEQDKKKIMKLEAETYQNASGIFTVSDHTRNSIINDYNVDEDKVLTIYNGVNIKEMPEFEKDYSNKTILFVGKEFERKGGYTLLKAFKEVKKEVKDAKLVIIGSEPDVDIGGVTVKGYMNHDDIFQAYKDSSVFAMPSTCEPFGIAFLEAMAYKTPCIGTTVDAMPEIISDGKSGFLVEPDDYKQLSDKLILLLEDEIANEERPPYTSGEGILSQVLP